MYYNKLILPDGRVLPDETVSISHVSLTRCVGDNQQLLPGGVNPAELEVRLLDPGGMLGLTAGDRVQLLQVEEDGTAVPIGTFFLEKPLRPQADILQITGYDALCKLDRELTAWLESLEGWPYTLAEFAQMVAAACGLTLQTVQMPNGTLPVEKFSATVTGRELMRWICQACCRFCRADPQGVLELGWFTESGVTWMPTGEKFYYRNGLSFEDYVTPVIDGVQLRLADGKSSCLWPQYPGENCWILTGNPFLKHATQQSQQALAVICQELAGLSYTPCSVEIPAGAEPVPGQMLHICTPEGRTIRTCVLESRRNGHRVTLLGQGNAKLRNVLTAADLAALDAQNQASSAVQNQTQQDIFDKLTNKGQAQGIYLLDGQVYINASYLAAGVIRSADGTVQIDLGANTVTVSTEGGKLMLAAGGLYGFGEDGTRTLVIKPGTGSGTPALINSFEAESGLTVAAGKANAMLTLGQPGANTQIRGKTLSVLGKTVAWVDNGDGTYILKGT